MSIREIAKTSVVVGLLTILFIPAQVLVSHDAAMDIRTVFCSSDSQYIIYLFLAISFTLLVLLRWFDNRFVRGGVHIWCFAYPLFFSIMSYAFCYLPSIQALSFLIGAGAGQVIALWAADCGTGNQKCGKFTHSNVIMSLLVVVIILISLGTDTQSNFQYRDHLRWSGLLDNPNLFGVLMGVGLTLTAGLTIAGLWMFGERWKVLFKFSCSVALCWIACGLFYSYSRGAWIGALCGIACLAFQYFQFVMAGRGGMAQGMFKTRCIRMLQSQSPIWLTTLFSALILILYCSYQTAHTPGRRAFTIVDFNDFSNNNRITAWKGAMYIMSESPWFGVCWGEPEHLYENYYLPPKLTESAAIQMNDFLMLGATLGIPALFCFLMYIWLSLTKAESRKLKAESSEAKTTSRKQIAEIAEADWLRATCRAGAIVLLVGFWFDGGLFKLPTAATFWILLELGRREEILTADITDNLDKKLLAEKYAQ